ncbi:hypothetical protein B0A50_07472 [Salinomyces thailandicus]|uniref:Uncharacterized protein n=1 Tax=Salinomyces thailandicus TaxID=706561 RepID=A0A4U0TNW8_9PEZI|nr:hypothetical protein B0A50_07472 [Salinomyces thailandica]
MHSSSNRSMPPSRKASMGSESPLPDIQEHQLPARKQSLPQSLPEPPAIPDTPIEEMPLPTISSASAPRHDRESLAVAPAGGARGTVTSMASQSSHYTNDQPAMPSIPIVNEPAEIEYDIDPALISTGRLSLDAPIQHLDVAQPKAQRLSVMGLRPLPPDHPEENPEIRANRIRSFYKEYFDDSRPNPTQGHYEEDYDPSYLEGAIYDPETGGFIITGNIPYAEGPHRRAMTPPPRAAVRPMGPHRRQMSTMSGARAHFMGRGPAPRVPHKKLPPPKPLLGLPTPAMLKDYDSVISMPIDFAPPSSFRSRQNGLRPESPLGGEFPYGPGVRAFSPLASSYDELAALPSPHLLRKSGTFTALDFAPPTFPGSNGRDTPGSDAGSIKSARSGISRMQHDAVRAGAYRVSRIPKNVVTTRDDMAAQLKPKWDLTAPA